VPPVRLNSDIPPKLEEIINKALEKDRNLRYQSAGDLRTDLQRLKRDTESRKAGGTAPGLPTRRKRHLGLGVAALLILAALVWGAYGYFMPKPPPFQKVEVTRLTKTWKVKIAAISPDGRYVAYVEGEAMGQGGAYRESIWVRQVWAGRRSTDRAR
jgi:hypothetical protein